MKLCVYPWCGRHVRAKGFCQTHYKSYLAGRQLGPIRQHRIRRLGAVKVGHLSLRPRAAAFLQALARRLGVSFNAVVTDAVEEWVESRPREREKARARR